MPNPYLTFSSPNSFTLNVYDNTKHWDGTLEYSTDTVTWNVWDGTTALSSGPNNELYLRGTGNTYITGSYSYSAKFQWVLTGSDISCSGNIENLLDYQTVLNNQHPAMGNYCYSQMFYGCTSLAAAPALPAVTLSYGCYREMFKSCTSLITAPVLPATTLSYYCYDHMFEGCTALTTPPALPATALNSYCYYGMFRGCTSLTTAPALPATMLAAECYIEMFRGCTSLITAPELPATTLTFQCYYSMFYDCTSLTTAPSELPAITLTNNCYSFMFRNCTSLITAPVLPATALAEKCYYSMFNNCTSLIAAPTLPATTLAESCYGYMFMNCTSLAATPELPATTLADRCYTNMFYSCTSLATASSLPAITLAEECYSGMFLNCASLIAPPELPATTLAEECYYSMFAGCTSIKLSATQTEKYQIPYRIPSSDTGTVATDALTDMFMSTGGTFTGTPEINTTYYLWDPTPTPEPGNYLLFKSPNSFSLNIADRTKHWDGDLEYSVNSSTWTPWDGTTTLNSALMRTDNILYIRGTGNSVITGYDSTETDSYRWVLTGSNISIIGNIENLLDYQTVIAENHPVMADNCYYGMFKNCTALTTVSSDFLSAITLSSSCYKEIFSGCTSLETVPNLPAPTVTDYCYCRMFKDCSSLTAVPQLPATTLADSCYQGMFQSCTSLTIPPALPATTLTEGCYSYMFGQTSLITAPVLPANILATYCYEGMFQGCNYLTTAPALSATTLASWCYQSMFEGCTSLKTVPTLPVTTLAEGCYTNMFSNCTSLTTPSDLPATVLTANCYANMFNGCTSIKLSAIKTLDYQVPYRIPSKETGVSAVNALTDAFTDTGGTFAGTPEINKTYYLWNPAVIPTEYLTLRSSDPFILETYDSEKHWDGDLVYSIDGENWIYWDGTTSLQSALIDNDEILYLAGIENTIITGNDPTHKWILTGSSAIECIGNIETLLDFATVESGEHPTMSDYCYAYMFQDCENLTTVSADLLNATTLSTGCYYHMFDGCSSLTSTLSLPAEEVSSRAYEGMFIDCNSLEVAPTLPATILNTYSYKQMFKGCTSIQRPVNLLAENLAEECYCEMYANCTSIKVSATETPRYMLPYAIEVEESALNALTDMFVGTSGTFTGTPLINTTYYLYYKVKKHPKRIFIPSPLKLSSSKPFTLSVKNQTQNWDGVIEYSTDRVTWTEWDGTTSISSAEHINSEVIYLRGTGNTVITGEDSQASTPYSWILDGSNISCIGNIENLLDYQTVMNSNHPQMGDWCFSKLFYNSSALISAPELPSTDLTKGCYASMFFGCTSLTTAPDLPATVLAEKCYQSMFSSCTSLTTAPELPATTLADYCYSSMFSDCYSFITAPELPAITLAEGCYERMFTYCTALESASELPATTLAENCYLCMFKGCQALQNPVALPALVLPAHCYEQMFMETSIKISATETFEYSIPYRIPEENEGTTHNTSTDDMFRDTPGSFSDTPMINTIYYLYKETPVRQTCLTFSSSDPFAITAEGGGRWDNYIEYSTDGTTWSEWDNSTSGSIDPIYSSQTGDIKYLFVRGVGNSIITGYETSFPICWHPINNDHVDCTGNIETLLDYPTVLNDEHPQMDAACYHRLFDYIDTAYDQFSFSHIELPAIELADSCYEGMFAGCNSLITAPNLPANAVRVASYQQMFYQCESLINPPEISATDVSDYGCEGMFEGCISLTTAPELLATSIGETCYGSMFAGCTSLTTAPTILPATQLYSQCYMNMFQNCTSLTTAPELPASRIPSQAYSGMFQNCNSLITAPELPITGVQQSSCAYMFNGCTSLTTAPLSLSAIISQGNSSCYSGMFKNCISLTAAPALPSTTLADYCYQEMFSGCTSLLTLPSLPATTLTYGCYQKIFNGCTSIKLSSTQTENYRIPYRIPSVGTGTDANYALTDMFTDTSGTFAGTPEINKTYYLWNPIPTPYLTFSSPNPFTINVYDNTKHWDGTLEYSTDTENWMTWNGTAVLNSGVHGDSNDIYLRGAGNTVITGDSGKWELRGTDISCIGNIETLLDYQTVVNGQHPTMGNYCYSQMFYSCTSLTSAPSLSATTLADYCYSGMFQNCTSLTLSPELPATTLAPYCYTNMFWGCTSVATPPELPATTLAWSCYTSMFAGCTSLTSVPELPATTLANGCYNSMFYNCISLTTAPQLSATVLAGGCYSSMFYGCTSLVTPPQLPATTLTGGCYKFMFHSCTSLTTPPLLPATMLAVECYYGMFYGCTSLISVPQLPATVLADSCYKQMFQDCTSLTTVPSLPATTLVSYCYQYMFSSCTSIKLSSTQTGEYQTPYRIPTTGTGTTTSGALTDMFLDTGGTFTGTPAINITYYTSNTIIPANQI